jgi:hypothetical protein
MDGAREEAARPAAPALRRADAATGAESATPVRRALTRRAWLAVAAAAAAVSCSRGPSDPVEALLAELTAAAEVRDADRLAARLGRGFRGVGGLTRDEAVAQLRRYFAAYESVGITTYGLEVDRAGEDATVRVVVEFSGRARSLGGLQGLLPPSAVYRFRLETAPEEGLLKVRAADWEPARLPDDSAPKAGGSAP